MKFIIILLSFFLSYGVAIFAADQKIASRTLNFKDDENAEKLDMLSKEMQNLLGRIEVLEHTISNLQSRAEQNISLSQDTPPQIANNQDVDDIFEIPTATISPASGKTLPVKIEEELVVKKPNNDQQAYDQAIIALKDAKLDKNKLAATEQKFADFIKNFPKSSLQSKAYFWHGETYFRREIYDQAAISYLKGYKQAPKGEKAGDSLLKLAYSLGYSKRKNDACGVISKLESEFPNRPADSIKKANEAKIKFGCK